MYSEEEKPQTEKTYPARFHSDTSADSVFERKENIVHNHNAAFTTPRQKVSSLAKRKALEGISSRPNKLLTVEIVQMGMNSEIDSNDSASIRRSIYRKRRTLLPPLPKHTMEDHSALSKIQVTSHLGFSNVTLEEEDITSMQLGGLYPLNKYYTIYLIASFCITLFTIGGMAVGSYLDGELNVAFESAHLLIVGVNLMAQFLAHHHHHVIVDNLLRAIDNNFFSYGDTMDGNTRKMINEHAREKRARKRMYVKLFKFQVTGAILGVIIKRILLYLIYGRGLKDVDGENGLMYQAPVSVYVPFSNYWVPYVVGMVINHNSMLTSALTAMATLSSFIRFSEELLHQLQVVKLGLRSFMARASHLYTLRYGRSYILESGESDKDFDRCLIACLTKSVEHHAITIKLFEDFKKLMFIPLFTVIFDGSAIICISTVLLLTSNSLALKISMPPFIAVELFYTYIYCSYGEQFTNLLSEIGDQMYSDDWLAHSNVVKPYMIIIKAFTFNPKKLSAGGFTSPNLESFGNVMRTAYSLVNFLVTQK